MKFFNILIVLFCISCTMDPKYNTPKSPVELQEIEEEKITWKDFFTDSKMQDAIQIALNNNRDLRIAYLNIKVARGGRDVEKSRLLPNLNIDSTYQDNNQNQTLASSKITVNAYEVDIFGRLRSAKKSAQQTLLSKEENANTVKIVLIAEVASSYIRYSTLKANVEILNDNIALHKKRYEVLTIQNKHGSVPYEDLHKARISLQECKSNRNTQELLMNKEKNTLSLLLGDEFKGDPLPIKLNIIDDSKLASMPSSLLLSRPDIKKAEHELKSANANIGIARANFFPSISLTGGYGFSSDKLSSLFSNESWSYGPLVSLPIFSGGRNLANLRISKAKKEIAVANYEKAVQVAFKEALNSLDSKKFTELNMQANKKIKHNSNKILDIKKAQEDAGLIEENHVRTYAIDFNSSKILYNNSKQDYMLSLVNVYKTLGQGY